MNNKQTIIIIAVVILILGGGFFAMSKLLNKKTTSTTEELTPTPFMEELSKDVKVSLTASSDKREVTLTISGMQGKYKELEYELSYDTNKGPKGTLSGSKPLPLSSGQDEFTRDITLGTCSSGKCTYDEGVNSITVVIKLYKEDDTPEFFKEDFEI